VAITGGFSYREIKDVAEDFRKSLYRLKGVAKVEMLGVQDERIWLEIDIKKLGSIGVQLSALTDDLRRQNIILPAGNIEADGVRILLEASGDFPDVRSIEAMLTRVGQTDQLVRLSDIVTVRRGYASPKVKPIYFNGRPAIVLSVVMQPDQDVTRLGTLLRSAARDYEATLPIGYAIELATFQADQVGVAVSRRCRTSSQTFAVVASLSFSSSACAGLIATLIVPFAVMFAVIGMRLFGIAIEQVSIAAVIALGLLVDNGVVIVEDIAVKSVGDSAERDGAGDRTGNTRFRCSSRPLRLSPRSCRCSCCPARRGEYAFSLGAVVALTLAGSWIAALYILPSLTVWLRQAARVAPCSGVRLTRSLGLRLRGEARHQLVTGRAGCVSGAGHALGGDVRPRAETDVSAQRAQPIPDLYDDAGRHRDFRDRSARSGALPLAW
jgi:multidrug efflux pump subunit AcrB